MQKHGIQALCLTAFPLCLCSLLLVPPSLPHFASLFIHPTEPTVYLALRARESQMNKTLRWNLTLESHASGAA